MAVSCKMVVAEVYRVKLYGVLLSKSLSHKEDIESSELFTLVISTVNRCTCTRRENFTTLCQKYFASEEVYCL